MPSRQQRRRRRELFSASLATGIGQALAEWAAEYTHDLLERNPDVRARLRANWRAMYDLITEMDDTEETKRPAQRRARRARSARVS